MLCPLANLLADASIEDVFKSAQDNMNEAPGSGKMVAMILGGLAIAVLLAVLQTLRKREATAAPVNNHGRLLKEAARGLGLKSAEMRQLKEAAAEQSCSSPLTLLLCPSLLARSMAAGDESRRQILDRAAQKANLSLDHVSES